MEKLKFKIDFGLNFILVFDSINAHYDLNYFSLD
jgi:hypothetical protein